MLTFIEFLVIFNKVRLFLDVSVLIANMVNISIPQNINNPHEQKSLESSVLTKRVKAS